jgi:hypothetical protein
MGRGCHNRVRGGKLVECILDIHGVSQRLCH